MTPNDRLRLLSLLGALGLAAFACNTVEGAGEDMQSAGEEIEEEAEEHD
jgi:predicted small secreted protein